MYVNQPLYLTLTTMTNILPPQNAASIIARAEVQQDVRFPSPLLTLSPTNHSSSQVNAAAALIARGEEGSEAIQSTQYDDNDYNDNQLGYFWPGRRRRRQRYLDWLRKWIMYWRGDEHACGFGTQNIGLC